MKREDISNAVGNISLHHIQEAEEYGNGRRKGRDPKKSFGKVIAAAVLVMGLFLGGLHFFTAADSGGVLSVYAKGMDEEIPASGIIVASGSISDSGSMKGFPLMFSLDGEKISEVRFSCRNQKIRFLDYTEKRPDYGQSQNFTVPFGEEESDYPALYIEWQPVKIIGALQDKETTIASLPKEMREDIIVMEITFADGRTDVKAITIWLEDDGSFLASFDDYAITEEDEFVFRPDSGYVVGEDGYKRWNGRVTEQPLDRGEPQMEEYPEDLEAARQAAMDYYAGWQEWFEVVKMGLASCTADEVTFYVRMAKRKVVQEPDRKITLKLEDGGWKVTGEGY